MRTKTFLAGVALVVMVLPTAPLLRAADNLSIAPNLNYGDHNKKQGRLIFGDNLNDGIVEGKPNVILFYFEECYNAKRQAKRTVELYRKYHDYFHFVIVDVDQPISRTQRDAFFRYSTGKMPHTTIIDKKGHLVFDYSGEVQEDALAGWMDFALRQSGENSRAIRAVRTSTGVTPNQQAELNKTEK